MNPFKKIGSSSFLVLSLLSSAVYANIEITLKNDFIEQNKDKATISVSFTVDKAHVRPNPATKDGDLHVAGRAPEVGLAIVAEIMNAGSQTAAVKAIHDAEGTANAVPLTGVWRIWCEHGGDEQQDQEKPPTAPFTTTNPPHVFEIHPITTLNENSIIGSLKPIVGYKPKEAEAAFLKYESLKSHITVGTTTTSLTTTMAGFNYVEFVLVPLDQTQDAMPDGTAILASARTLDGDMLVHKRRMIFVKDSPEEKALKKLKAGEGMHVLGIPRISLKLLSFRAAHHGDNEQMLDWGLPYEIAIVGFYGKVSADKLE